MNMGRLVVINLGLIVLAVVMLAAGESAIAAAFGGVSVAAASLALLVYVAGGRGENGAR